MREDGTPKRRIGVEGTTTGDSVDGTGIGEKWVRTFSLTMSPDPYDWSQIVGKFHR